MTENVFMWERSSSGNPGYILFLKKPLSHKKCQRVTFQLHWYFIISRISFHRSLSEGDCLTVGREQERRGCQEGWRWWWQWWLSFEVHLKLKAPCSLSVGQLADLLTAQWLALMCIGNISNCLQPASSTCVCVCHTVCIHRHVCIGKGPDVWMQILCFDVV